MSVLGTGVAAGVAQTALQAQQVARQRDKQETDTGAEARSVRDLFDSHLKSLEESAREQSATHLHVDEELPEHQSQEQQRKPKQPKPQNGQPEPEAAVLESDVLSPVPPPASAPNAAGKPAAKAGGGGDAPLYRHLDLQA